MTHVVVGANGFIGAHLAQRLNADGDVTLVLGSESRWRLDALDVSVPATALNDVDWGTATSVCMAAGFGTPTVFGARAVATLGDELALHRKVNQLLLQHDADPLVVVMGSRTQYGAPRRLPVIESDPPQPQSIYALEKQMIEDLYLLAHEQAGTRSLRLRITNPYGPLEWHGDRRHGLVSIFVAQLLESNAITVFGSGTEQRDYLWIGDLVELIAKAVDRQREINSVTLNAGSGIAMPIIDLAGHTLDAIRAAGRIATGSIEKVEVPLQAAAIESGSFVSSVHAAHELLDWQPATSLCEGIQLLIEQDADRIAHALR